MPHHNRQCVWNPSYRLSIPKPLSLCIALAILFTRFESMRFLSLGAHMKDLVYKKKPTDLISLKRSITDSFASIKSKTLGLATDNFVTSLGYFDPSRIIPQASQKTVAITFPTDGTVFTFWRQISLLKPILLVAALSQPDKDGSRFHPLLQNNAKVPIDSAEKSYKLFW
ncbi:hypothetical protein AVEN_63723-1 [Araneus ventricosus]|uniref:Uncharacterized protein n=1 Tax=Araneus ventricosus TaxID=182803 RepID=A0A4Y2KRU5_ARAVE|nr:hypothetical protein AVEN_63723-1 [Araneus ventricosus]